MAEHTSLAEHTSMAKTESGMASSTSSVGPGIPNCTGLIDQTSMASPTYLLEELKIINTDDFRSQPISIQRMLVQSIGERQKLAPETVQQIIRDYVRVDV